MILPAVNRNDEEKLTSLLTVSAMDTQFARHKYGSRLDEARAAAREWSRPAPVLPAKDYERDQREWQAAQQLQTQQEVDHEVALKKWYGKRDGSQESMPKLGVVMKPRRRRKSRRGRRRPCVLTRWRRRSLREGQSRDFRDMEDTAGGSSSGANPLFE